MKTNIILYPILLLVLLAGCKQEEFLYQDISSRIWLGRTETTGNLISLVDSMERSFMFLPADQEIDTLYITANLMGETAPYDRNFVLAVVMEETNVPSAAYSLGEAIIPANSFTGQVPVVVNKHVEGLNLKENSAFVTFQFIPNDTFLEGVVGRNTFKLVWSDFLPKPPSWDLLAAQLGPFSQARYKFILTYFGEIDFQRYVGNFNLLLGLQSTLRKRLLDYNTDSNNQGRPEGWPYLNDNGTPLTF